MSPTLFESHYYSYFKGRNFFASDYEIVNHIINKLRDYGLRIAIDAFGTGYSSLARVEEMNVNCLKIDKYFIDMLLNAKLNKVITSDIISMAHKLEHYTIAEGVDLGTSLCLPMVFLSCSYGSTRFGIRYNSTRLILCIRSKTYPANNNSCIIL